MWDFPKSFATKWLLNSGKPNFHTFVTSVVRKEQLCTQLSQPSEEYIPVLQSSGIWQIFNIAYLLTILVCSRIMQNYEPSPLHKVFPYSFQKTSLLHPES